MDRNTQMKIGKVVLGIVLAAAVVGAVLMKSDVGLKDSFVDECEKTLSAETCSATLSKEHARCLNESRPRRELSEAEYKANPGNGKIEIGQPDPANYTECMMGAARETKL